MITFIRILVSIVIFTILWLLLVVRWIIRNPTYSEQARSHEVPYPWFFKVWAFLVFLSCISLTIIVFYYIYLFVCTFVT